MELDNILSASVPLPLLRSVRPLFSSSAELPRNRNDSGHDDTSNQGVGAPVRRLRVPTTGWRPDVLGVTVAGWLDMVIASLSVLGS